MTLLQLKRMEKRFWCHQERRNPQKVHVQDVQNCRLLAVTLSSLIYYKIFDVVTKLWLAKLNAARTFLKHAFIVSFKAVRILEILIISINISSHTCDKMSSRIAVFCCQHPKARYCCNAIYWWRVLMFSVVVSFIVISIVYHICNEPQQNVWRGFRACKTDLRPP